MGLTDFNGPFIAMKWREYIYIYVYIYIFFGDEPADGIWLACIDIIWGEQDVLPQIQFGISSEDRLRTKRHRLWHHWPTLPEDLWCRNWSLECLGVPTGNLTHLWPVENSQFIGDLPSYNMVMSCDVPFSWFSCCKLMCFTLTTDNSNATHTLFCFPPCSTCIFSMFLFILRPGPVGWTVQEGGTFFGVGGVATVDRSCAVQPVPNWIATRWCPSELNR